jgi:hypothetical protein
MPTDAAGCTLLANGGNPQDSAGSPQKRLHPPISPSPHSPLPTPYSLHLKNGKHLVGITDFM